MQQQQQQRLHNASDYTDLWCRIHLMCDECEVHSFLIVCYVLGLFLRLLFWDFDADDELPECGKLLSY